MPNEFTSRFCPHVAWSRSRASVVVLVGLLLALLSATLERPALAEPTRLVGSIAIHFVAQGETLLDIARDNNLGILELMSANPGLDPWIPPEGSPVYLPGLRILPDAPHRGIVINLAERRLYLFGNSRAEVQSWPIGVGRLGFTTPLGSTRVAKKKIDPVWYPTVETRAEDPELPAVVPPGPDNPMGRYALYLGWPQYAVHGTNRPWGIGRRVSRGCIRLYPEDIEVLFDLARVGMDVTVVDQVAKLAWHEDRLYLEIHPSKAQLDHLEEFGHFESEPLEGLLALIKQAAGERASQLDLANIRRAERERLGIPVAITKLPPDKYLRQSSTPARSAAP